MLEQSDWLQTELDELTSSPEDFPAKTSPSQVPAPVCLVSAAACGPSFSELSLKFDPVGQLLRMSLGLELSALTGCSLTWQERVTPLGRWWWVLSMPELPIDDSGFGLLQTPSTGGMDGGSNSRRATKRRGDFWNMLPTPSATTYGRNKGGQNPDGKERPSGAKRSITINDAVKWMLPTPQAYSHRDSNAPGTTPLDRMVRWGDPNGRMLPTPTARDWKSTQAGEATHEKNSRPLSEVVGKMLPTPRASEAMHAPLRIPENIKDGSRLEDVIALQQDENNGPGTGRLSPCFVEWMMGYPAGWTDVSD